MRQYVNSNNPATVITSSMTNVATTIDVSVETYLPSDVEYAIMVGPSSGPFEIMLVTGGAGTGTLTVTRGREGTSATAHNLGENVYHTMTAGTLDAIRSDSFQIGLFSARPSDGKAGDVYYSTDRNVKYFYDGSAWVVLPGSILGTASFSSSGGSISNTHYGGVVSSVARSATGVYVVNFSAAQINFGASILCSDDGVDGTVGFMTGTPNLNSSLSSVTFVTVGLSSNNPRDPGMVSISIFKA